MSRFICFVSSSGSDLISGLQLLWFQLLSVSDDPVSVSSSAPGRPAEVSGPVRRVLGPDVAVEAGRRGEPLAAL